MSLAGFLVQPPPSPASTPVDAASAGESSPVQSGSDEHSRKHCHTSRNSRRAVRADLGRALRRIYQHRAPKLVWPDWTGSTSTKSSVQIAEEISLLGIDASLNQFEGLDPLPFLGADGERAVLRADGDCQDDMSVRAQCVAVVSDGSDDERRLSPFGQYDCELLDLNMSGVALRLAQPIASGTELDLQIAASERHSEVDIRGTVVRCEPATAGGYHVICRLKRYLTFAEIHALGRGLFAAAIV